MLKVRASPKSACTSNHATTVATAQLPQSELNSRLKALKENIGRLPFDKLKRWSRLARVRKGGDGEPCADANGKVLLCDGEFCRAQSSDADTVCRLHWWHVRQKGDPNICTLYFSHSNYIKFG